MQDEKVTSHILSEIDELLIKVSQDFRLGSNRDISRRLRELSDSEFERLVGDGLLNRDDVITFKHNLLTTHNAAVFVSTLFRGWIDTGKFRSLEEAADFARRLGAVHTNSFTILASQECRDLISKSTVSLETMVQYIQVVSSVCSLENIGWHLGRITGSFEKRCEIEEQYFRNWDANLSVFLLRNAKVQELLQQGLPDTTDQIKEIALSILVKYRDAAVKFTVGTDKYFKESDAMMPASDENPGINKINELQKRIIEGTLAFPFQSVSELEPSQAVEVLRCVLTREVSPGALLSIVSLNIEDEVKFIHDIILHPCPQNRTTSYPYFEQSRDPSMVVYKNKDGRPAFEKRGLLSLTANNDESTAITKKATCSYIVSLVEAEISKLSNSTTHAGCSFWNTDSVQITFNELIDNLSKYYIKHKELGRDLVSKIKTFPRLGLLFSRATVTADNLETVQCLLLHFSEIGDVESTGGLLSHNKVDVDFVKYFGRDDQITALSKAAYHGQHEVVRLLLNKGALINTQNTSFSPFLWAVRKGHANVVRVFLEAREFSDLVPANTLDKLQSALTYLRLDNKSIVDDARREAKIREYDAMVSLIMEKKTANHDSNKAKPH